MNGLEIRKVYYNQDGSMDWLKSIVRTVYIYNEIIKGFSFIQVCSVVAKRTSDLYYRKTDLGRLK